MSKQKGISTDELLNTGYNALIRSTELEKQGKAKTPEHKQAMSAIITSTALVKLIKGRL